MVVVVELTQIHARRVQALVHKPDAVDAHARLHGIIPAVCRADIVVRTVDEGIDAILARRIRSDLRRGNISEVPARVIG